MTWARLDDDFPNHPKVVDLSDAAFRLHVTAICYSAKWRTRGEITQKAFRIIAGRPKLAAELVAAAVWDSTSRDGWSIHDFEIYNPSRDPADNPELSQKRAEAGRRGGQISASKRASKIEANGEANLLEENEANSQATLLPRVPTRAFPARPDPDPDPGDPQASPSALSSSAEREIFDTALSKLPLKYQRDGLTVDELEQFARDFPGRHTDLANAITACRQHNELCFAGNLRKYMPGGTQNGNRSSRAVKNPSARDRLVQAGRLPAD